MAGCAARRGRFALLVLSCTVLLAACGGGGGGGSSAPPPGAQRTTFTGNLAQPSALGASGDAALAQAGVVQVCVAGTSFCTEVDDTGAFTLAADVGGDVVLLFDGPGFSARLALSNVPRGATVRIPDIVCSTATGQCHAASVEIVNPLNEPPVCDAAAAQPAVLWPPNHQMVRIAIVGVVDPDGDPVVITATAVTSNEPDNAPGSGNTAPDSQLNPLAVRAERSGQGNGRIYTIDFVADDGHGGRCMGTVFVCVPHDQGNGSTCS